MFCATLGSASALVAFLGAALVTAETQAQVPAAPRAKAAAPRPATGAPTPPAASSESSSEQSLPKDFVPPRVVPAIMTLEKPLITAAEFKTQMKALNIDKFPQALRNGDLSQRKVLQQGAKVTLFLLTIEPGDELAARKAEITKKYDDRLKKVKKDDAEAKDKLLKDQEDELKKELEKPTIRAQLTQERDRLVRDINNAANLPTIEAKAARDFRNFYMKEVVEQAKLLLDGNFQVRLNAVILLSELNLTAEEPFIEAVRPLLDVLANKDQPEAVKIPALRGVARIVQAGRADPPTKLKITETLVSELKRRDIHWWYQMRLAEVLGQADPVVDLKREPIVAQVLMETLVDETRHCAVRSEAARALGRNSLEGGVNAGLIAFEVAHVAQQLAAKYNNDVKNQVTGPFWKQCYLNLYLAFKPADAAGQTRGDGLYTKVQKASFVKHKPLVEEAYKHTLSLVNQVFPAKEAALIPDTVLTPVTDWLKKSQPADDRLAPGMPLYKPSSPVVGNKQPAG